MFSIFSTQAQLVGYGDGSDLSESVDKNEIMYLDNNRASVKSMDLSGSDDELTLETTHGTFTAGKKLFIVQMTHSSSSVIGIHEGIDIKRHRY